MYTYLEYVRHYLCWSELHPPSNWSRWWWWFKPHCLPICRLNILKSTHTTFCIPAEEKHIFKSRIRLSFSSISHNIMAFSIVTPWPLPPSTYDCIHDLCRDNHRCRKIQIEIYTMETYMILITLILHTNTCKLYILRNNVVIYQ